MKKLMKYAPRVIVAFILLQTLYFKFGIGGVEALNESKEIFGVITAATLGSAEYESYMRIGTGIFELIASILILFNGTVIFGAILGAGLMGGALLSHFLFIGIEVRGDGGQLFIMALVVLLCCIKVLFDKKELLLALLNRNNKVSIDEK